MKPEYLEFLCCPECQGELDLTSKNGSIEPGDRIETGAVGCKACDLSFEIRNFIPRFVDHNSYASSFGPQWNAFATSQLDNEKNQESTLRFNSEIGWTPEQLNGKTIVEFGSGAGRFIDVASVAGLAVGIDITDAVDASQKNLGDRDNVFFIQADIFKPPVRRKYFDFAYSIGVIHHTPEPQAAFNTMVDCVKDDGHVAISLYDISLYRRPNRNNLKVASLELLWSLNAWRCELFRQVTTRVPHGMMIAYCKTVIPVLHFLNKIPVIGLVRYLVPSTCYSHLPAINSMVDTMDTYSTRIVHQYRSKDVFQWFLHRGLKNIVVMNSRAGWVSVNANLGDDESRTANTRVLRQPDKPGTTTFVD
jgi:SAM-dependent methyltransferase